MRPIRIRFTIRLLMAVVAISAVALAGVAWSHWMRLREDYRSMKSNSDAKSPVRTRGTWPFECAAVRSLAWNPLPMT
jgi:hypothetical protein